MVKNLAVLKEGEIIKMIHKKEPLPLYEIIKANSLAYHTISKDGIFYIFISRQKTLEDFLKSKEFKDV